MLEVLHPGSYDRVNWGNVTKKFRRKRNCACRIVSVDSHRSNLRPRRVSCIPTMHKGLLEIPKKDSNDNGGKVKDNNRQITDTATESLTDPLKTVSTKANSQRLDDETSAPVRLVTPGDWAMHCWVQARVCEDRKCCGLGP